MFPFGVCVYFWKEIFAAIKSFKTVPLLYVSCGQKFWTLLIFLNRALTSMVTNLNKRMFLWTFNLLDTQHIVRNDLPPHRFFFYVLQSSRGSRKGSSANQIGPSAPGSRESHSPSRSRDSSSGSGKSVPGYMQATKSSGVSKGSGTPKNRKVSDKKRWWLVQVLVIVWGDIFLT